MIRTAKPLTAKEKKQLDKLEQTHRDHPARPYAVSGVLGFVGGAGMMWWIIGQSLASGGTSTLAAEAPFLRGIEAAVGPLVTAMLVGGVLFGVAMLGVAWQMAGVMRATRQTLRARYLAAGAEGEAPHEGRR